MSSLDTHSDVESQVDDSDWEDWEGDEHGAVKSLFSDETFATVDEAIAFDAATHAFDLRSWRTTTGASEYDTFRVINFIRSEMAAGHDPRSALAGSNAAAAWQSDDAFLRPVLENDELLLHDWDAEGGDLPGSSSAAPAAGSSALPEDEMAAALGEMQQLAMQDAAVRDLLLAQVGGGAVGDGDAGAGPSEITEEEESGACAAADAAIDAAYFESYSFFDIHREMLSDRVRTEAYRAALERNPGLLKGASVLDVGCGTGVLSLFAARGGAAKVYAVDGSPEMAAIARKICAANGFGDGTDSGPVTVLSSKVEALETLPGLPEGGKVDVLVSEWMGYALLFETMLDSVLAARDKFLKPGGAVLPDVARIFVAAAGPGSTGLDFWTDVYGLNMSPVAEVLSQSAKKEAVVRHVDPQHLLTEAQQLVQLDLATMRPEDQDFSADFELKAAAGPRTCSSLVLWFDTLFTDRFCADAPQELPTGPYDTPTHWAQTVLVLPETVVLAPAAVGAADAAVALRGRLSMARRTGRHRTLDLSVEYEAVGADGGVMGERMVQLYSMGVGADS